MYNAIIHNQTHEIIYFQAIPSLARKNSILEVHMRKSAPAAIARRSARHSCVVPFVPRPLSVCPLFTARRSGWMDHRRRRVPSRPLSTRETRWTPCSSATGTPPGGCSGQRPRCFEGKKTKNEHKRREKSDFWFVNTTDTYYCISYNLDPNSDVSKAKPKQTERDVSSLV